MQTDSLDSYPPLPSETRYPNFLVMPSYNEPKNTPERLEQYENILVGAISAAVVYEVLRSLLDFSPGVSLAGGAATLFAVASRPKHPHLPRAVAYHAMIDSPTGRNRWLQ